MITKTLGHSDPAIFDRMIDTACREYDERPTIHFAVTWGSFGPFYTAMLVWP
jgi:hypothetical protein